MNVPISLIPICDSPIDDFGLVCSTGSVCRCPIYVQSLIYHPCFVHSQIVFFSQYVVRPFTDAMRTITKVIGEFIEKQFQHEKTTVLNPFNNCVLITYLPGMAFPEH
jgi:hypothetical protein